MGIYKNIRSGVVLGVQSMRGKVLQCFTWVDENRVRAVWIAVAFIALVLVLRILLPF